MTKLEFDNIKWERLCHFTGGGLFETTYKAKDVESLYKFVFVHHDPFLLTPKGKESTEYEYKEKCYTTVDDLLKAMDE